MVPARRMAAGMVPARRTGPVRWLAIGVGAMGATAAVAPFVAGVVAVAASRSQAGIDAEPPVEDGWVVDAGTLVEGRAVQVDQPVDGGVAGGDNQSKRLVDTRAAVRWPAPPVPTGGRSPARQRRPMRVLVDAVGGDR